jgi:uncharacterized membrane protein YukC
MGTMHWGHVQRQSKDHFRYWVQNGKDADSEAVSMATSYEMPIGLNRIYQLYVVSKRIQATGLLATPPNKP